MQFSLLLVGMGKKLGWSGFLTLSIRGQLGKPMLFHLHPSRSPVCFHLWVKLRPHDNPSSTVVRVLCVEKKKDNFVSFEM